MWRLLKLLTVPVQAIMKTWNTRLQFFGYMRFSGWTYKSNRYFSIFFTVQRRLSKAHAINCSCFPTEHKTRYINNKRNNELKKIIHDRISLLFRIHLCNFVHFQYIQADNRILVIHWCWCSLHSRDKSGFLYTRQCLWNHRWKYGISKLCKKLLCISHYRV